MQAPRDDRDRARAERPDRGTPEGDRAPKQWRSRYNRGFAQQSRAILVEVRKAGGGSSLRCMMDFR